MSDARSMRKWLPLIAICLGTFMLLIDVTIVNVALPSMAGSLHTSFGSLQWVIDAYALALAALLLGIGSVADLVGHRRSYLIGLLVFAGSSLLCGLAPNAGVLVAARAVQGVGGAAMFATTAALLNSSYQGRDRGTAFGFWGAVSGAAAAIGPILGGVLVQGISWRWIFFVNIPVCALAIVMTVRNISSDHERPDTRVDVSGTVTFTAAAACLTYGLIYANEHSWSSATTYGLIIAAVVAAAAFVVIEARSDHAMLDLSLFRSRSFVGLIAAALLFNFAAFSSLTYSSIWLQTVIGLSPIKAGLSSLPLAGVAFLTSATAGRKLHGRPGPVIGTGITLIGVGGLLIALLVGDGSSWPALIPGYAVIGVGVGIAIPVLTAAAMASVPVQRGGMAAGAINTARQLGYGIGIAVLGTVFASRAGHALSGAPSSVAHDLAGGQAPRLLAQAGSSRAALDAALHRASISGIDATFLVAGISGVVAGLLVWALVRPQQPATAAVAAPAAEPAVATGH